MAWRATDSLAVRSFLRLAVDEAPPDHSTMARTRRLIDLETHRTVFTWVQQRLVEAGRLTGKTIAIDATTLEANAAMRSIVAVTEDAEVVITLDADLNHQPEEIPKLLTVLRDGDADVVVGSRFVAGSRVDGSPLWKRCLSGVANPVMRRLYGLQVLDVTSGYRLYRAAVLRDVRYLSNTFSFLPELLIRINTAGYRIIEEPIHFIARRQGTSKLPFWLTSWSYLALFAARLSGRRLRRGRESGRSGSRTLQ